MSNRSKFFPNLSLNFEIPSHYLGTSPCRAEIRFSVGYQASRRACETWPHGTCGFSFLSSVLTERKYKMTHDDRTR